MKTLPELHYTPKSNKISSITSYCSGEDPVGTCKPESHNREFSRNQA